MTRRWDSIVRKMMPVAGAGILLQVGACNLDLRTVTQELVTAAVSNLITSFVYGLFNIPMGSFGF